MRIDKEGHVIIRNTLMICVAISLAAFLFLPQGWFIGISIFLLLKLLFVVRFFRVPHRVLPHDEDVVYAPADGTIVVVEKTFEDEYLKRECLQVSIFMSVWNVHANWFPIGGKVKYFKHHHGLFLVAWHPKSSTENERTTTVVEGKHGEILFRQIAGLVAKRIVSYANVGTDIKQNQRCGFIKFGSRVDLYLPLDAKVEVAMKQKVVGTQTVIARLK